MRLSRLLLLPVAALSVAACGDDDGVTVTPRPPLGGVRFIHGAPDVGAVDIRMIDQVEWSASSVNLAAETGLHYRNGTTHWSTEAKQRRVRVWPTSPNIDITSTWIVDTTITVAADKNVTLMLVGNGQRGGTRFIEIDDTAPATTGQQIAVRAVNGGVAGGVEAYITATATTAPVAPAAFSIAPEIGAATYAVRDTGAFAIRAASSADPLTPVASAVAPTGAPEANGIGALAGFRGAGSALSAFVFPRACPSVAPPLTSVNCVRLVGRNATDSTALANTAVVWYVDRIPAPPAR